MNQVLNSTSRSGDFVHNTQTMAKAQGFRNVSKLWYDKTISISEGVDSIIADAKCRFDTEVTSKDFNVNVGQDGKPALVVGGKEYSPTEHAWKLIASWFGKIPQTYINWALSNQKDSKDSETFVSVFRNNHRKIDADKKFIFRLDTNNVCRAMFTDKYMVINNVWYMETLAEIFKTLGGDEPRLSHWKGDSDTVYGNLLIPDTVRAETDSDYGGMLSLSNCEIGLRRLTQLPSIFRAICQNGCVHGETIGNALNKVHRGKLDFVLLRKNIFDNINTQIPLMDGLIKQFIECKNYKVDMKTNMLQLCTQLCLDNSLSLNQGKEIVDAWVNYESNDQNAFGFINAITRAGQKFDPKTWFEFDVLGGKIMQNVTTKGKNGWEHFNHKASILSESDMKDFWNQAV